MLNAFHLTLETAHGLEELRQALTSLGCSRCGEELRHVDIDPRGAPSRPLSGAAVPAGKMERRQKYVFAPASHQAVKHIFNEVTYLYFKVREFRKVTWPLGAGFVELFVIVKTVLQPLG